MTPTLAIAFIMMTSRFNLPVGLLPSICYVETGHDITAIHRNDGVGDSIGVCQIKYETAVTLNYKGTKEGLQEPTTNVFYAAKYLNKQIRRYNGDVAKAVSAYNAGRYKPINQRYVTKVFKTWELADNVNYRFQDIR